MSKKQKIVGITVFAVLAAVLLVGIVLTGSPAEKDESVKEVMRDAVLHETNKVSLFGMAVNPGLIAAFCVTGILVVFSLAEQLVGFFDNLAKTSSPHRNSFLGAYVFAAGCYVFISTLFELFGFQAIGIRGNPITLPAPLSDINGAIALGVLSYGVILFGGLAAAGFSGMFKALKDFSLPISMSFRLFGALLSGALVTELVYYYTALSFVLPVFVGVMFTLLHALIQTYVLTMLTTIFYGESTEKKIHGGK